MKKRIFHHRIDSASQRLESLDSVLKGLDGRARKVRSLRDELANQKGEIQETLENLTERIGNILNLCDKANPDINYIRNTASSAQEHLRHLEKLFEAARANARGIFCLQLDPNALVKRNGEFKEKIAKGRKNLEDMRGKVPGVESWTSFRNANVAWIEYLDYLGGLCLRHERVDNGVCEIADALINEIEQGSEILSALAIPGRDSGAGTLPRAVYLRFPEWTVWALPLAIRELWHIA